MRLTICRAALLLLSLGLSGPWGSAQPPSTVLIQGQLLDTQGNAIAGLRQYRVRFFNAETEGAQVGGTLIDLALVGPDGLFSFAITPPAEALGVDPLWYELALDSTPVPNGVDGADVFPNRIRVHSVPFARVAEVAQQVPAEGVGDGSVGAAEFGALAGISGNIQSQLNAKASTAQLETRATIDQLADRAPRVGPSFVAVEVTDDAAQNGLNLLSAYLEASFRTPHGLPLGPNNRAVVLVPPGRYDLGFSPLTLSAEYVDLVGLSTAREAQHILGVGSGGLPGVIRQFANDVRIENLTVECTRSTGGTGASPDDPAAYFPNGDLAATVVRNCRFVADGLNAYSMRAGVNYAGTYEDSVGGVYAFGGESTTTSGVFVRCEGGDSSFGSGGNASGTFIDCVGGNFAFGGFGTASGTFTRCRAGDSSFGAAGTANGTFTDCTGAGFAFGGGGIANGTFVRCVGGSQSFGGSPSGNSTGAVLIGCRMTGATWSGTFRGTMEHCRWGTGATLTATARIYGSTFLGTLNLNNTAAGVTQSRAQAISNAASNVFGATSAAAFNIAGAGVQ